MLSATWRSRFICRCNGRATNGAIIEGNVGIGLASPLGTLMSEVERGFRVPDRTSDLVSQNGSTRALRTMVAALT